MPNLYKTSENKVLLSAGSRIIKQPYNFGKMFMNRMGLNNYIRIANLNLSANSTIMNWVVCPHTIGGNKHYPFYNLRNNTDNISLSLQTTNQDYLGLVKNNFPVNGVSNFGLIYDNIQSPQGLNLFYEIIRTDNTATHKSAYRSVTTTGIATTNIAAINEIDIGALRFASGTVLNVFAQSTTKYSEFVVFDRELSDSEFKFYYSNACGSELQSTLGVSVYLKNDKAEILDFSVAQDGSDLRVGVRDYSGFNRHGEIINLPSGTPQYKVDYANTNLFI